MSNLAVSHSEAETWSDEFALAFESNMPKIQDDDDDDIWKAFYIALERIAAYSRCQCTEQHGDNLNCPVLLAESALASL